MDLSEARKIEARVENGAWIEYLRNYPGVSVKVRGEGNSDHERFLMEAYQALGRTATQEDHDRIEKEAVAATILLDWKGITEPCTPENKASMLELKTFRRSVMESARAVGRAGIEVLEEQAKNSSARSAGSSTGARTSSGSKH